MLLWDDAAVNDGADLLNKAILRIHQAVRISVKDGAEDQLIHFLIRPQFDDVEVVGVVVLFA